MLQRKSMLVTAELEWESIDRNCLPSYLNLSEIA
jgi:hypothetical protein